MKIRMFIVGGLALALTGAGCSSSAPTPVTNTPVKTTPPARQMVPTGDAQLPDGFPTDYPRYTNSVIVSASMDQRHATMSLSTEDEAGIIQSWYAQAFISAGYEAKESAAQGNLSSKSYEKGNIKFVVNTIDQGADHPKTLFSVTRQDLSIQ
jgi:hypothetical protein